MSFLHDDEFIILQVLMPFLADYMKDIYVYSVDDRKRLRDVGVQTALEYISWREICPTSTEYNWNSIESRININRAAGMKTAFMAGGWILPEWIPSGWYARHQNGQYEKEVLSLWNKEAQEYSDLFYMKLLDLFCADDVMFVFGEFQGNEGIYPSDPCFYDVAAIEDYQKKYGKLAYPNITNPDTLDWYGNKIVEYSVRKQSIFNVQHQEIWNSQQLLMDVWAKGFGNFVIPETFAAFRDAFPNSDLVFSQFTYFDQSHYEIPNEAFVDRIKNDYNAKVLVEAHFAQGLKDTAPKAIAKGFRGQICGPVHHQSGYDKSLEQWMLDEIGKAHLLWLSSKG